jgi:hypothetical protein
MQMRKKFWLVNKGITMKKTDVTIHCVAKNESFIYYAIKAVYNYCDSILLYDTSSTDKHTLEDIQQLLKEDVDKKIIFRQVPLEFDEEKWSLDTLSNFIKINRGKMSVGKCRQMQIDETKTKYFLIVDGDEVHYRHTMELMINDVIPNWQFGKICVGFPLIWFWDLKHTFTSATFPVNGRLLLTDRVYMSEDSPNEQHLIKGNKEFFTYEHPAYLIYDKATPYAHFESVLRPWRRKHCVEAKNILPFRGVLPEVMIEQPYYLERYIREQS